MMNSNLHDYLDTVAQNNAAGVSNGLLSLNSSLPCSIYRELEVLNNRFVVSSDPFMVSYRALNRIQHVPNPVIPRKIQFESAVYLKEGVIDLIFPNSDVTLIFIGDGNSDKRFSYNCHRLFRTFGSRLNTFCYICNDSLIGKPFGPRAVEYGWNTTDQGEDVFYHARGWAELGIFVDLIRDQQREGRQVIVLIDIDGTYLCPRPHYNNKIKDARRAALASFCQEYFDSRLFADTSEQVASLNSSYQAAEATRFSVNYDDEDLTMLVTVALFFKVMEADDQLLTGDNSLRFNIPVEFLTYCSFLINNHASWEYELRQLRTLFVRCADAITGGSPTAFAEFREKEERALVEGAIAGEVTLNRAIAAFTHECAQLGAVPLGYSDRPNAPWESGRTRTPRAPRLRSRMRCSIRPLRSRSTHYAQTEISETAGPCAGVAS